MTTAPSYEYRSIPLDLLDIAAVNVRRRDANADVDELAANMAEFGLQQPIVVRVKGTRYEILIGQRRFLAAQKLGWEEIDARIVSELTELDATIISFSENMIRRDLAPADKADACQYLLNELGSVKAVADRLGVADQTVRKWLGYAAVPAPLKDMVAEGTITVPMAISLSQHVPDESKAVAIAQRVAEMKAPPEQRNRILAAVEEAPDRSIDVILRRAAEKQQEKRVVVVLPEKWGRALDRASKALQQDAQEIAREAVIDWLEVRRY